MQHNAKLIRPKSLTWDSYQYYTIPFRRITSGSKVVYHTSDTWQLSIPSGASHKLPQDQRLVSHPSYQLLLQCVESEWDSFKPSVYTARKSGFKWYKQVPIIKYLASNVIFLQSQITNWFYVYKKGKFQKRAQVSGSFQNRIKKESF